MILCDDTTSPATDAHHLLPLWRGLERAACLLSEVWRRTTEAGQKFLGAEHCAFNYPRHYGHLHPWLSGDVLFWQHILTILNRTARE